MTVVSLKACSLLVMMSHFYFNTGKSLYITRLFERFKATFRGAHYIRIRLIEPRVNMSAFLEILTGNLNRLREQDPVLLHIDTAAVSSLLELSCFMKFYGI